MSGSGYLKFRNDRGVPEICIGVREFECIGVSPPQGHPHVYINMGEADTILVVGQSNWAQFTADEATVWVNRLGNQALMRLVIIPIYKAMALRRQREKSIGTRLMR
jgi:uncharacterized Zn-finger protein